MREEWMTQTFGGSRTSQRIGAETEKRNNKKQLRNGELRFESLTPICVRVLFV